MNTQCLVNVRNKYEVYPLSTIDFENVHIFVIEINNFCTEYLFIKNNLN